MNQINSPLQKVTQNIKKEVCKILSGEYEESILGTIDKENFPYLSKIVPMFYDDKIFLLLSDLSEHTQNANQKQKISIYFKLKENHKDKLNNPRLTITGKIKKLNLQKDDKIFKSLISKYIKFYPSSKLWSKFLDFNFYEVNIKKIFFIKGFGKAYHLNKKDLL